MKTVRESTYDEYLTWYLQREYHKGSREHVPDSFRDRHKLMKTKHRGKYLECFPRARWNIVSIDFAEFKNLVYLDSPWTKEEGLTNQADGKNYRLLSKVAVNAIERKYFEIHQPGRERHHHYYKQLKDGEINLKNDRLVLCTLNDEERTGNPDGSFYLHDGNGRALPYLVLVMERRIAFQPVEAFLASKSS